jgi:glycosyltransferase involved in cell wall biosynthesis
MVRDLYPLVTIAIPTYNRADRYLVQALESAVKQTYENIEIIVADNCSSDHTEELVKSFKNPRIRYFRHSSNIGADPNWNFCLREAKGEYFLLLQDDEAIDSDFVAVCMQAANYSTNIGLIRTGARIIDEHGKILHERKNIAAGLSPYDFVMAFLSRKLLLFLSCSLFNTRRLCEISGPDCHWTGTQYRHWEDVYSELEVARKFGRIDIPDVKGSYRAHLSTITYTVKPIEWIEDSVVLLNYLCELFPENEAAIRSEGRRCFASVCYDRARNQTSTIKLIWACLLVYKTFRVLDGLRWPSVWEVLAHTPLYYPLKLVKVNINRLLQRA